MRNHVSKVLVGVGVAYKAIETLAQGEITAYDAEAFAAVTADTKLVGYAMGTAVLGEPVLSAVFPVAKIIEANKNAYEAPVLQKQTLTIDTVPEAGRVAIFKISYHDNLSIIPNQIKQTTIAVEAETGETTSTFAAKIAAEFNLQEFIFATVTVATNVVTFEAITMTTASNYNSIDRPESVAFEIGASDEDGLGAYTVAETVAPKMGQGTAAKVAWMEENAQGRRGYSDRRLWNDTKKFVPSVDPAKTYDVYVINADVDVQGDLQNVRHAPTGVIFASDSGVDISGVGSLLEQTNTAFTFTTIPASS